MCKEFIRVGVITDVVCDAVRNRDEVGHENLRV